MRRLLASALMLLNHGSRFDIGKENGIAPWYDNQRLSSAKEWADKFFSGKFPGDALAKRGYVVLTTAALGWGARESSGYDAKQALMANLFNLGSTLSGLIALEDMRATAFLVGPADTAPRQSSGRRSAFRWAPSEPGRSPLCHRISATITKSWMAHCNTPASAYSRLKACSRRPFV